MLANLSGHQARGAPPRNEKNDCITDPRTKKKERESRRTLKKVDLGEAVSLLWRLRPREGNKGRKSSERCRIRCKALDPPLPNVNLRPQGAVKKSESEALLGGGGRRGFRVTFRKTAAL